MPLIVPLALNVDPFPVQGRAIFQDTSDHSLWVRILIDDDSPLPLPADADILTGRLEGLAAKLRDYDCTIVWLNPDEPFTALHNLGVIRRTRSSYVVRDSSIALVKRKGWAITVMEFTTSTILCGEL